MYPRSETTSLAGLLMSAQEAGMSTSAQSRLQFSCWGQLTCPVEFSDESPKATSFK